MIDLTPIAETILTLAGLLITTFLIPWLKTKITEEQSAEVAKWVKIAVSAAEMIYAGVGRGAEKKAYVQNFLAEKGYKLDTASVDAMIEAAVLEIQK